jgi:hypothetical protein
VYIRSESGSDGTQLHEVIDGQQRIRSILRFAENDLELRAEDLTPALEGLTYDDLSDAQRSTFWNYKLVVRELEGASESEIRELFRRVNLNSVDLNDQELRHAHFEGYFIHLMEDLADDPWWLERGIVTVREVRRMTDVEFISELMVGLMAGPQNKKLTLDDYYVDYESDWEDHAFWKRHFKNTREIVDELVGERLGGWRGKSEFYTLFLVVGDLLYAGARFDDDDTIAVSKTLKRFRADVDQAKKRDNAKTFPPSIEQYSEAVTRAATDLSRRATRDRVLRKRISSALRT